MVDIASRSRGVTLGFVYDIHHIARSVLRLIREEHHIFGHYKEVTKSYVSSIRPPMSSTAIRMQPIQGQERGGG